MIFFVSQAPIQANKVLSDPPEDTKNKVAFSKSGTERKKKEEILKQAQSNRGAKRASGAKRATNCRR
ncbi:hypothetical protein GmHk_04G009986 [Glycine max]|nr:hypothetical protein GmHk_04G009986 [Glycine max]